MLLIGAWNKNNNRKRKTEGKKKKTSSNLLTVVLRELIEKSASLLGLEISQHGGDDGADVFWGENKAK